MLHKKQLCSLVSSHAFSDCGYRKPAHCDHFHSLLTQKLCINHVYDLVISNLNNEHVCMFVCERARARVPAYECALLGAGV